MAKFRPIGFSSGATTDVPEQSESSDRPKFAPRGYDDPSEDFGFQWFGRRPSKPLEEIEGGELLKKIASDERQDWYEALVEWDRSYIPEAGDWMDAWKKTRMSAIHRQLEAGEFVTDEQLVEYNTLMHQMRRQEGADWRAKAVESNKRQIQFRIELGIAMGLGALTGGAGFGAKAGGKVGQEITEAAMQKAMKRRLAENMIRGQMTKSVATRFGQKLGREAVEKAVTKEIAEGVGQKIAKGVIWTGKQAVEANMKGLTLDLWRPGAVQKAIQDKRFEMALSGEDDNMTRAFVKGIIDTHIEHASEMSGEALGKAVSTLVFNNPVAKQVRKQLSGHFIYDFINRAFGVARRSQANRILRRMGYDGIANEMLEERAGAFLRGLHNIPGTGKVAAFQLGQALKDSIVDPVATPEGREDLAVEFLTFLVPGAARYAGSYAQAAAVGDVMPYELDRNIGMLQDAVRKAQTEQEYDIATKRLAAELNRQMKAPWYMSLEKTSKVRQVMEKYFGDTKAGSLQGLMERLELSDLRTAQVRAQDKADAEIMRIRENEPDTPERQAKIDKLQNAGLETLQDRIKNKTVGVKVVKTEAERDALLAELGEGTLVGNISRGKFNLAVKDLRALDREDFRKLAKDTDLDYMVPIEDSLSDEMTEELTLEHIQEPDAMSRLFGIQNSFEAQQMRERLEALFADPDVKAIKLAPPTVRTGTRSDFQEEAGYVLPAETRAYSVDPVTGDQTFAIWEGAMNVDGVLHINKYTGLRDVAEDALELKFKARGGMELTAEAAAWSEKADRIIARRLKGETDPKRKDWLTQLKNMSKFERFIKAYLYDRLGEDASGLNEVFGNLNELGLAMDTGVDAYMRERVGDDILQKLSRRRTLDARGPGQLAVEQVIERTGGAGATARARALVAKARNNPELTVKLQPLNDILEGNPNTRAVRQALLDEHRKLIRDGVTFSLGDSANMTDEQRRQLDADLARAEAALTKRMNLDDDDPRLQEAVENLVRVWQEQRAIAGINLEDQAPIVAVLGDSLQAAKDVRNIAGGAKEDRDLSEEGGPVRPDPRESYQLEFAKQVFSEQDWWNVLPYWLKKLGFGDFEKAPPDIIEILRPRSVAYAMALNLEARDEAGEPMLTKEGNKWYLRGDPADIAETAMDEMMRRDEEGRWNDYIPTEQEMIDDLAEMRRMIVEGTERYREGTVERGVFGANIRRSLERQTDIDRAAAQRELDFEEEQSIDMLEMGVNQVRLSATELDQQEAEVAASEQQTAEEFAEDIPGLTARVMAGNQPGEDAGIAKDYAETTPIKTLPPYTVPLPLVAQHLERINVAGQRGVKDAILQRLAPELQQDGRTIEIVNRERDRNAARERAQEMGRIRRKIAELEQQLVEPQPEPVTRETKQPSKKALKSAAAQRQKVRDQIDELDRQYEQVKARAVPENVVRRQLGKAGDKNTIVIDESLAFPMDTAMLRRIVVANQNDQGQPSSPMITWDMHKQWWIKKPLRAVLGEDTNTDGLLYIMNWDWERQLGMPITRADNAARDGRWVGNKVRITRQSDDPFDVELDVDSIVSRTEGQMVETDLGGFGQFTQQPTMRGVDLDRMRKVERARSAAIMPWTVDYFMEQPENALAMDLKRWMARNGVKSLTVMGLDDMGRDMKGNSQIVKARYSDKLARVLRKALLTPQAELEDVEARRAEVRADLERRIALDRERLEYQIAEDGSVEDVTVVDEDGIATYSLMDAGMQAIRRFNNGRITASERTVYAKAINQILNGDESKLGWLRKNMTAADAEKLMPSFETAARNARERREARIAEETPQADTLTQTPVEADEAVQSESERVIEAYDDEITRSLNMDEEFQELMPDLARGDKGIQNALLKSGRKQRREMTEAKGIVSGWRYDIGLGLSRIGDKEERQRRRDLRPGHKTRAEKLLRAIKMRLDNPNETIVIDAAVEDENGNIVRLEGERIDQIYADWNSKKPSWAPTAQEMEARIKPVFEAKRAEANVFLDNLSQGEWIKHIEDYVNRTYKSLTRRRRGGRIIEQPRQSYERKFKTFRHAALEEGLVPADLGVDAEFLKWSQTVWKSARHRYFINTALLTDDIDGGATMIPIRNKSPKANVKPTVDPVVMREAVRRLAEWGNVEYDPKADPYNEMDRLVSVLDLKNNGWVMVESPQTDDISHFWVRKGNADRILKKVVGTIWEPEGLLGAAVKTVEWFNRWTKYMALRLSGFHPFSLGESLVGAGGLRLQNPLFHPINTWKQMQRIRREMREQPAKWADWIEAGLMTDFGNPDVQIERIEGDLNRWIAWADKQTDPYIKGVAGRGLRAFDWFKRHTDDWLWHAVHPLMKLHTAETVREWVVANTGREPDAKEMEDIARMINNMFGGQEWDRYLWATPRMKQFLHAIMFAPDWSLSAANISGITSLPGAKQVLQPGLSDLEKKFMLQRYWPGMAAVVLTAVPNMLQALIYYTMGGDPDEGDSPWLFMNEKGRRTYVDITPLMRRLGYAGGDSGQQRVYMRWGKQAWEIGRWLTDPIQSFKGKSSMAFKTAYEIATGTDTLGRPLAFKDSGWAGVINTEAGFRESRVGRVVEKFIPMSILQMLRGDVSTFFAPTRKGASYGGTVMQMSRVFEAYANPKVWKRITDEGLERNLASLVPGIIEAAERNGVDADAALERAESAIRNKYYKMFFEELNGRRRPRKLEEHSESIIRMHGSMTDMRTSVRSRFDKIGRDFDKEDYSAATEAFGEAQAKLRGE